MKCPTCGQKVINKGVLFVKKIPFQENSKKTQVRDLLGNKTSFKKLKKEHRDSILKDTIPKKGLLGRGILTKGQLEKGIKDGILKEILFEGRVYFNERELRWYVQKIMGLKTE